MTIVDGCDRINLVRFLFTGELPLMGMWLLLMMLICLKELVASHLLLSHLVCFLILITFGYYILKIINDQPDLQDIILFIIIIAF